MPRSRSVPNMNRHRGLNWKDEYGHSDWTWLVSRARGGRGVGGRYEIYRYLLSNGPGRYAEAAHFEVKYLTTSGRGQWNERWRKGSFLSLAEAKAAAEAHHEQHRQIAADTSPEARSSGHA
jgi:hypothetical protein